MIPPGFKQCPECGEYNGATAMRFLDMPSADATPNAMISVTCLCHGIPCRRCSKHLIHRPTSNTYDPTSNQVWHTPYFGHMAPCRSCAEATKGASLTTRR